MFTIIIVMGKITISDALNGMIKVGSTNFE